LSNDPIVISRKLDGPMVNPVPVIGSVAWVFGDATVPRHTAVVWSWSIPGGETFNVDDVSLVPEVDGPTDGGFLG
jgi:hypothetical protein